MSRGSPVVKSGRLGAYWTTTIAGNKAVIFKSESHLSQDTDKHLPSSGVLPNALVWKQIIEDVQPELVITTGTGGGIGKQFEVGDVIVSPVVRFASRKWLKAAAFAQANYHSVPPPTKYFPKTRELFKFNSDQLPSDNTRQPKITNVPPGKLAASVVTTDFFGFDTSNNYYGLKGVGDLSEMGDAVLGMVSAQSKSPHWIAVRNVSDPQIKAAGLTLKQQGDLASSIYKGYGRWSTVCSAITCWAIIAAL
jgi:nucleoside phosphorylase